MKKIALHWQIMIGMIAGILFGFLMTQFSWGKGFTGDWIAPLGTIFVNLLKLIAVPLILASLIKGISDLKDISKFKKIGGRTIVIYVLTTVIAITIGLLLVNVMKPGNGITPETIEKLTTEYASSAKISERIAEAGRQKESGPLQFVVDMVPQNAVKAMSDNKMMLQVIFFAIFLGISMLLIKEEQSDPLKKFFDSLNEVVLKMVDLIMLTAPYAVFALLANVVVTSDDPDILLALLRYAGVVVFGLALMIVFYCILVSVITKKSPLWFLKQISPAQLLAFSTSSSAATLPVTMERVEEHIGVDKEVSSFVLPVGATINMDGTAIMQGVATVFIANIYGVELGIAGYLTVILMSVLASIGTAGVPGVGLIMLSMVFAQVGLPIEGIGLILGVDRLLDMIRTAVNVSGDVVVSTVVAKSEGKLDVDIFNDPKAGLFNEEEIEIDPEQELELAKVVRKTHDQ